MTEKFSLSLSLSLCGELWNGCLHRGGCGLWRGIVVDFDFWGSSSCAIFLWGPPSPCLFSDLPEIQKRCLFLLGLHSDIWYMLFLHWRLEELLGFRIQRVCLCNPSFVLVWVSIFFGSSKYWDFYSWCNRFWKQWILHYLNIWNCWRVAPSLEFFSSSFYHQSSSKLYCLGFSLKDWILR